jgi:hypothetical protein
MKYVPSILAGLLGFVFIAFSLMFFLNKMPNPPKPPPADVLTFMSVFAPSGYLTFVKAFELIGGILVVIPKTRNWGLLVLGPIILNILAFNFLVGKGEGLTEPMSLVINAIIVLIPLYLLWDARKKFAGLLN